MLNGKWPLYSGMVHKTFQVMVKQASLLNIVF